MSSKHCLGLIPDRPDPRDMLYSAAASRLIPDRADLRSRCSPVRDQLDLGACTAFSLTAMGEEMQTPFGKGGKFAILSPLWLYYQERFLEGTVNQDAGASIRDGLKTMVKLGCALESAWKYDPKKFMKAPSKTANTSALKHKIASYHRVTGLIGLRTAIAMGNGAVIGIQVYSSFEDDKATQTGIIPMPDTEDEELLGGHAVYACGYYPEPTAPGGGYILIKNSWGKAWGDGGFAHLAYAYINSQLVSDMWTAS
jgi:C1A family cysteine protease